MNSYLEKFDREIHVGLNWFLASVGSAQIEAKHLKGRAWLELHAQAVVHGAGNSAPWIRLKVPVQVLDRDGWVFDRLVPVESLDDDLDDEDAPTHQWVNCSAHDLCVEEADGSVVRRPSPKVADQASSA